MSDLENLITQSRQKDRRSQRLLYERLANQMFLVCRRYLSNEDDIEEAMQDGFCKMFRALDVFSYRSDPETIAWVNRIMVNECLSRLKKEKRPILEILNPDEDVASTDDFITDLSDELYILITKLPENQRLVFNLFEIEGWSHAQIGLRINISERASIMCLHHAKFNLRKMFNETNKSYEKRESC